MSSYRPGLVEGLRLLASLSPLVGQLVTDPATTAADRGELPPGFTW